jgi:hypothetical protein
VQSESVNLTTAVAAVPEIEGDSIEPVSYKYANPFKQVDLGDVLTRQYLIANLVWTPSVGFTPVNINVDYLLTQMAQVASKLSYFSFFRTGVRIHVRMTASPFCYGKLMCSVFPPCSDAYLALLTASDGAYFARPKTISAASASDVEYEVAWTLPYVWRNRSDYTSTVANVCWLRIQELTPLFTANNTDPNVQIKVFAEFVNPEVAGYLATANSGKPKRRAPKDAEQEEKSEKGVIGGVARAVASIAPMLELIPDIGPELAAVGSGLGVLAPMFDAIGLAKPLNLKAAEPIHSRVYADWANTAGLSNGVRIAHDPDQSLDQGIVPEREFDLRVIAKTPSYWGTFYAVQTNTSGDKLFEAPLRTAVSNGVRPTYASYVSSMYAYWRGGMKFRLEFCCPKFFAARFQVVYNPNPAVAYNPSNSFGDVVSAVIDVRGDTDFDFVVPYLATTPYERFNDPAGHLQVFLINEIVAMDQSLTNRIQCVIWQSFADDVQFHVPMARLLPTAQGDIWNDFKKTFEPLGGTASGAVESGMVADEQVYDLRSILRRKVSISQAVASKAAVNPWTTGNLATYDYHRMILFLFYYWRGSVRLDLLPDSEQSSYVQRAFSGVCPKDNLGGSTVSWTSVELPYNNIMPYHSRDLAPYDANVFNRLVNNNGGTCTVWRSFGEDVECGWLLPTPIVSTSWGLEDTRIPSVGW